MGEYWNGLLMRISVLIDLFSLWGNKTHFDYINQEIDGLDIKDDEKLVIYRCDGNEGE